MLKLNHKNLDVWRLAIKLVSSIYRITSNYPKEELFGLTNQTRRASHPSLQTLQKVLREKV
jgi:hypothetical protein